VNEPNTQDEGGDRILIVGAVEEPHVEAVGRRCRDFGAECKVLSEDAYLSFRLDGDRAHRAKRAAGSEISRRRPPTAIWWRLKPGYFRAETMDLRNGFMRREWNHALDSLECYFPSARWINPRSVDRLIRHKPNQLLLARRAGLVTPATLVSNDPREVLDFIDQQPGRRCIYKPFSWFSEPPNRQLFTNIVDREFIRSHAPEVRRAPGIYQRIVEKAYELRITIVDRELFPVRIESQSRQESALDWRRQQDIPYYIETSLPEPLIQRLTQFHVSAGLIYGAYDMIVTPSKEYVFLEVNPVGQWLWLEEETGLQISDAVARFLAPINFAAARDRT
jgi:glutathione synthase/RimK-type ligase-like ATP-grasp enzyme